MNIHKPNGHSLALLDFEIVYVEKGEKKDWYSDEYESVFVIIEGSCSISSEEERWDLQRRSVFVDTASAIFISPKHTLSITAKEKTILAVCKARADKKFKTTYIPKENIVSEIRGEKGFKRKVFNIVNTETQTQRIAVGETINEPGEWSSFPPHKHDVFIKENEKIIEVPLEEAYYFRIEPKTGFGFQRLYTKDGLFDEAYVIQDGDVTHIPRGYHPVANIPGHKLYYLWMLAGEERKYIWNTDPDFKWIEKNSI